MNINVPSVKVCKHGDCLQVATSHNGYCFDHYRAFGGRTTLQSYSARPMPARSMLFPVGYELELLHRDGKERLCQLARYVCADGSLPDNGAEIKGVASAARAANAIGDLCTRAKLSGAESGRSCGYHLHFCRKAIFGLDLVDMSFDQRQIARDSVTMVGRAVQDWLFDLMPQSRRSNGYCRKIRSNDGLPSEGTSISSHYCWLSMSERVPTVEVRLHHATTNPFKCAAWVEVCLGLVAAIKAQYEGKFRVQSPADVQPFIGDLGNAYLSARSDAGGRLVNFVV
jgi:hypothetical protein